MESLNFEEQNIIKDKKKVINYTAIKVVSNL